MKTRNLLIAALSVITVSLSIIPAHSATIIGAPVFVSADGNVIATYRGNSASFSNDLYLHSPANSLGIIFNNHASAVGSSVDLGSFSAGTELVFRLHVNNTGHDFFTGPASRNLDGAFHARVDDAWSATETLVEFEDLFNGPFHFNDLSFSFTNVRATPPSPSGVPEASQTGVLFGGALFGLIAAAWVAGRRPGAR